MLVTIDIPESVVAEAKARGISVEALVRARIEVAPGADSGELPGLMRLGSGNMTPAEAGTRIKELCKGVTRDEPEPDDTVAQDNAPLTPAEAGARMTQLRKRYTLGGTVTIKQLIEEGRRY